MLGPSTSISDGRIKAIAKETATLQGVAFLKKSKKNIIKEARAQRRAAIIKNKGAAARSDYKKGKGAAARSK